MSNIVLTISADSAEELTALIASLASQHAVGPMPATAAVVAEPAKRGRPRKDSTPAEAPVAPTAETAPTAAAEPVSATPAAPAAVTPAPAAPAAAPAVAPTAADSELPASVDKPTVTEALIAVVSKHGREACGALCRTYGAGNLTAVDPKFWPALYRDAKLAVAQDKGSFKVPTAA